MECDCGHSFSEEQKRAIVEGYLHECPTCSEKFQIRIRQGSMARLNNRISIDITDLFSKDDTEILKDIKEGAKQLFNRYGYNYEDFEMDMYFTLRTKDLEKKYIIEKFYTGEPEILHVIRFEKL